MSEDPSRVHRIAAEQMLSGAWVGWGVGSDPLADLLAAQATAAREDKLAGARTTTRTRTGPATRAARGAHRAPARSARTLATRRPAIARLATVKAAVALAVLGGGGVALAAAGTGHLPGIGSPKGEPVAHPNPSVAVSRPASGSQSATGATSGASGGSAQPSGTPSPNMRGLCMAFEQASGSGETLGDAASTVLITAAGSKDAVPAYCATVLAFPPSESTADPAQTPGQPSTGAHPPGPPTTAAPTTHPVAPPTTPPTTPPTGAPTTHPGGGPPSTHPTRPGTHPGGRRTTPPAG
jgi:hypothetical protein